MDTPHEQPPVAWQPLTPLGVAAFARASLGRLLLAQLCVAFLAAGAVAWFVNGAWFSLVSQAVRRLPPQGEIRSGALDWPAPAPVCLGENRFLALVIDPAHAGSIRSPAHVQLELGQRDFRIISLAGFVPVPYPRASILALNRPALEPWWEARRPAFVGLAALLVIAGLMLVWAVLATIYCLPTRLAATLANRHLSAGGSWRLAGAALMPGALAMTAAVVVYGLGAFDLIQLAMAAAGHLVLGWVYLLAGALAQPRRQTPSPAPPNPLVPPRDANTPPAGLRSR
jgi:hypothetical protein